MRDANIKKLVLAALMAALTYVATSIVQIPSPMQGFVNLGDCIVLLSGWILGPWWGIRWAAGPRPKSHRPFSTDSTACLPPWASTSPPSAAST